MAEDNRYSGVERRRGPRYRLDDNVQVWNLDTDSELGVVADLHSKGFMLMCPKGANKGHCYHIKMLLPRHINGCSDLTLKADCLWTAESMTESHDLMWAGFEFIPDSLRALISIDDVISEFGIEPKS